MQCMYVCMHLCMYVRAYVFMYVCMLHVCMHVCMCVCRYIWAQQTKQNPHTSQHLISPRAFCHREEPWWSFPGGWELLRLMQSLQQDQTSTSQLLVWIVGWHHAVISPCIYVCLHDKWFVVRPCIDQNMPTCNLMGIVGKNMIFE